MQRIYSIDYLRGLMALSVLIYHFESWSLGAPNSETILGRLGVYAVSIFFIISGMSLYTAYKDYEWNTKSLRTFIKKRYLRLAPAFWVACILMVALFFLTIDHYSIRWKNLFYNLSLTFGLIKPGAYITAGGWSIGNEVVFYLIFPAIMWLSTKRREAMWLALSLSFVAFVYYAFVRLDSNSTMGDQWFTYIEPLNNALLFVSGVFMAWASEKSLKPKHHTYYYALLTTSIILFIAYPADGDLISVTTGANRLAFTAICMTICLSVLNIRFKLTNPLSSSLKILGDISYTIYMFHGVTGEVTLQLLAPALDITTPQAKFNLLLLFTLPLTLLLSFYFFRLVESPAMRLGKAKTI